MPPIERIHLRLDTADTSGAKTDGHVYLGICGREFRVNSPENDFQQGASDSFRFGHLDNVENSAVNDPRAPQLFEEQADQFPVYLRFDPENRGDDWILEYAQVVFNFPSVHYPTDQVYETQLPGTLQMGHRSTLFVYLVKREDTRTSSLEGLVQRVARFIRSTGR